MTFSEFAAHKTREAQRAVIHPLVTIDDRSSGPALEEIGSAWTRSLYDGPFHLIQPVPPSTRPDSRHVDPEVPAVSLVFVRSKDGNTGADNPGDLGGGATDKHFLYEGLSRVAVDAVLAGATTAAGESIFFSVWHPELVALRASLGLPRHPVQMVVTRRAGLDPDSTLIFNVPDVPVIVLAGGAAAGVLARAARARPWMHIVPMEETDVRPALQRVRADFGIRRISCVGGRSTATALIDAGVVQDIHLTTTGRRAGEPGTPLYVGDDPPVLEPIVRKRGTDPAAPFVFEHVLVSGSSSRSDPTARR